MSEPISLLNVIKQGGFDASLITTFNASLPFYEEVVLRRLVAAGCQQNIVLMDHAQCAVSWQSEATRPRLAGAAYSLLPVKVSGAFHPKVCILAGKKKAAILVGSHNLTLSGFGYNREITNWVQVSGSADKEGGALLGAVWGMVREWIELVQGDVPSSLIEAVLSFSQSVAPLSVSEPPAETIAIHQRPGGSSLIDQIGSRVQGEVRRICVTGAFFDSDLAFVDHLHERWPQADIVVGIDPDTVHMPSTREVHARFVDARPLWAKSDKGGNKYLHAKALYIEQAPANRNVLISGSANPSRPAWMGTRTSANVEAVVFRMGSEAESTAEALGLSAMFALQPLSAAELEATAVRSVAESTDTVETHERFWIGVATSAHELQISTYGVDMEVDSVNLLTDGQEILQSDIAVTLTGAVLSVPVAVDMKFVRSCDVFFEGERVARAMIAHPHMLSAATKSSHRQVRDALGALDPSGETISDMLKAVENAIFDASTEEEVENELRSRRSSEKAGAVGGRPETLEISVTQLRQKKKRRRLVESADIVTLIELLTRKIGEDLDTQPPVPVDSLGRSEEEQVNQDDGADESNEKQLVDSEAQALLDAEIAKRVARKVGKLVNRILVKLEAAEDPDAKARAIVQLIAVLALVKELLRIERLPRWRAARELLVREDDRRYLLDESVSCLFGSKTRLINAVSDDTHQETEEALQLRVLLLWLAWSLGDEVPESSGDAFDAGNQQEIVRAKAMFLALTPPIAVDEVARNDLRRHIALTHRQNPSAAARAERWMRLVIAFGEAWSRDLADAGEIEIGGCCIVGDGSYPQVICRTEDGIVGLWDYGGIRSFQTSRVIPVWPEASS
ncbi:hypothetical protein [Paraburkholderia sp. RL17-337-BIB-A]|uniref:hypothetical protein n=1 Tax=Paraburkholderia sp. RL17-337-BIB-A TaxID=3031636 RepID=UPI0038BB1C4B